MLQYDPSKRLSAFEALKHPFFAEGNDEHVQYRVPDLSAFIYPKSSAEYNVMHHSETKPVRPMDMLQSPSKESGNETESKSTAMCSSQEGSAVPLKLGSLNYSEFHSKMRLNGGRPSSVEAKSKEEVVEWR